MQPHGPYLLGGFSGGGLTAWEMARQLEAAGETVSLLVLLDTPLPMRPPLSRLDKGLIKLAELKARGLGYVVDWAKARYAWEIEKRRPKAATEATHQFHNAEIEAAFRAALPIYALPLRKGRRRCSARRWTGAGRFRTGTGSAGRRNMCSPTTI